MLAPLSHLGWPKQQHVMRPRSTSSTGASVSAGGHSIKKLLRPPRFAVTSQNSANFSRPNASHTSRHQEAQATPLLPANTTTNGTSIMTKSATLLLLLFLLPLIVIFIYNLLRQLWRKTRCPSFPSSQAGDPSEQKQSKKEKKKPTGAALVVELANTLTTPRVQLLNRVKRQFVDNQFAARKVPTSVTLVVQERATVETHLAPDSPDAAPNHQEWEAEERKTKKVESVISNEQEEGDEKQVERISPKNTCRLCGQASQELEERCHSHSPRASQLSELNGVKLAGGCSVSPIMLNCQQELGCACGQVAGEQQAKLAQRRLLRQAASVSKNNKDRCLRLFYEHYYDNLSHEQNENDKKADRRLGEFELANSRGLQESAQELMQLAESEQSLYSSTNPNKSPHTVNNRLTPATTAQHLAKQLVASSTQLRPNGSDCELASSTSTSLGGSDSGFGGCKLGSVCTACQKGTSFAAGTTTSSPSTGRGAKRVEHSVLDSKPSHDKSISSVKWRRNQRLQVAQQRLTDLELDAPTGARRMSVAGDQICTRSDIRNAQRFQSNSPRILQRSNRRPSDTYLYGHEGGGGVDDSYNKSAYSSSCGSSSGIGVSGSACTNTPTTSAFPYSSFVDSEPPMMACNLMNGYSVFPNNLYHNNNTVLANLLRQQDDEDGSANSAASRKYSLPVQLEWQAAERLSPKCGRLLFDRNLQHHHQPIVSQQLTEDSCGGSIASSLRPEETRRSSQTITRQSSFWLADQSDDSVLSLANLEAPLVSDIEEPLGQQQKLVPADQQPCEPFPEPSTRSARASLSSIAVLSGDSIESVKRRPLVASSDKCSTSIFQTATGEKATQETGGRPLSARNSSSTATSNSNGCSPSPPDLSSSKANDRVLGPRSSGLIKRPKLKTKRHQRSEDVASKRRKAFKMRTGVHQHSAPSASNRTKDEQWDDDDDDDDDDFDRQDVALMHEDCPFGPMQSTCSLPQHIRKACTHSYQGASTIKLSGRSTRTDKKDSATLERQCKELWKLRATLHDDSCFSDNWANYHQRLNRRYDSGYKSIEHQFSSSFEGPLRAATGAQTSSALVDGPRPPSSCSNQQPTNNMNEIENKMSHLGLDEDQKDTPTTDGGERGCHSRSSKCSDNSSNDEENNKK